MIEITKKYATSLPELQKLWDNIEGGYPANYQNLNSPKARAFLRALSYLNDLDIVEIGCNSGLFSCLVSNVANSIYSVDIDNGNILRSKITFDYFFSKGLCKNNITFKCGNIVDLFPKISDSNCLIATCVLYHLRDNELCVLIDFIKQHIKTLIVQCRPERRKLVENGILNNVSNLKMYNGLYDLPDNVNFIRDCGFVDITILGVSESKGAACPVLIGSLPN